MGHFLKEVRVLFTEVRFSEPERTPYLDWKWMEKVM